MTTKTTKGLAAAPKRTVKKAKLTAGIELSGSPALSADELQAQIRRRAYELYLHRSPEAGNPEGDWLQAEYEVMTALNTATAASVATPAKAKATRAVKPRSESSSSPPQTPPTRTRRKQPPATPKT